MIQINQDLNVESLIEEIEFSKETAMGMSIRSTKLYVEVLETEKIYDILKRHFPQLKQYLDEQQSNNNSL